MKQKYTETNEDINNVEAWVEIINDLLRRAPRELRAEILAQAVKCEAANKKEYELNAGFVVINASEVSLDTPGLRNWHTIMRLKSLVVQIFVRNIHNNHSPKEAAKILFAQHAFGTGSGRLEDYLK
jgi:hypothetical protein